MSLVRGLREKHHELWEKMVAHPFVRELGNGTLPIEKFRAYFIQDYIFVRDLVSMTALGVSKAPDFDAANRLTQFLSGILRPENDLFERAFRQLGVSQEKRSSASASPTTQAFGDFLMRTGLEGDFRDILTILYVTEGTYLDWGSRLIQAGERPGNPIYREWIDIHGPQVLGDLVGWMGDYLDSADAQPRRPRIEGIFLTTLRYEYMFWEAAYRGQRWPDQ